VGVFLRAQFYFSVDEKEKEKHSDIFILKTHLIR
jgi:hypothetical protein